MLNLSIPTTSFPATERIDSTADRVKLLTVASFGMSDVEAALLDSFVKLANRTRGGGFVMLGHKAEAAVAAHLLFTPLTFAQLEQVLLVSNGLKLRKQQMLVSTTSVDARSASFFVDVVMPPLRPLPVMDVLVKCKDLYNEQRNAGRDLSQFANSGGETHPHSEQAAHANGAAHTVASLEIWKDSATAVDVARIILRARNEAALYQIGFDSTTTVYLDGTRSLLVAHQSVEELLAELPAQHILGVRISPNAPDPTFSSSSLDKLSWQLAQHLLPARLLPWLTEATSDGAFQLLRWPDFGRLGRSAAQVSMAAALTKRHLSPMQLAKASNVSLDDAQRFINACSLLNILAPLKLTNQLAVSAVTTTANTPQSAAGLFPPTPAQTFKRQGLLSLIKNRLGFK